MQLNILKYLRFCEVAQVTDLMQFKLDELFYGVDKTKLKRVVDELCANVFVVLVGCSCIQSLSGT